jgi:glycine cleavage system H protein
MNDQTFMMGKFAALLPGGLRYSDNHMWCREVDGRLRFGFTSYAVRLMQDVYFLDWTVAADTAVAHLQHIGHIETSKAVSDLYAPIAGTIVAFNRELLKDPTPINVDTHGPGWLFEMTGDASGTLDATGYHDFLAANWEKTQRLIKGKMNLED